MRKYAEIEDATLAPTLLFALPELVYAEALNAVRVCLDDAAQWGERPAFLHGDSQLTFARLEGEVGRYTAALGRLGVKAGDRVLMRMPDTPALVLAILATQAIGAIAVPTYVQLRADDLLYRVRDAAVSVALVGADLLAEMRPVAAVAGSTLRVVAVPRDIENAFDSFDAMLPAEPVSPTYADTHADDVALILYTSGSTGRSKGTLHAHRDLLATCDTYARYCVKPRPGDVIGGPAAVPFALGIAFFVYYPLRSGAAALLEPDKSPETAIRMMDRHGVTIFVGVASYYTRLLALVRARGATPPRLRVTLTGGEPLLPEVERGWRETTGLALRQFLGTTETLSCFLGSRVDEDEVPEGTMGFAIPGYECSVRDPETFAPLPAGTPGLLCMRGPTGTRYWNRPEEQRKVVREGWNVFQDIVVRDERGFLRYVSRSDDMIITAGHNISPVSVETVLIRHPAVADCACVPAPDPSGRRANIIKAYVVLHEGATPDATLARELQDYFIANAPRYMYPRAITFLPALPKTVNGKVLRAALRKLANEP
jgi:2-aminobenzoate-CoA ligase